jgi:hypothetical protein
MGSALNLQAAFDLSPGRIPEKAHGLPACCYFSVRKNRLFFFLVENRLSTRLKVLLDKKYTLCHFESFI